MDQFHGAFLELEWLEIDFICMEKSSMNILENIFCVLQRKVCHGFRVSLLSELTVTGTIDQQQI